VFRGYEPEFTGTAELLDGRLAPAGRTAGMAVFEIDELFRLAATKVFGATLPGMLAEAARDMVMPV
jgi:hypothetical protein